MRVLLIFLLSAFNVFSEIKQGEYIVTESDHGWFRKGFYEKVDDKNMMWEDMSPEHNVEKKKEYVYQMFFFKHGDKDMVELTMSNNISQNQPLVWGTASHIGEITHTKMGFIITLMDGKKIHFKDWRHHVL